MNRRFEDELLQAAFGDLTPEHAEEIERMAARDPEAARTLASFKQMRADLSELRDIPQHQLSTERLRHAIEQQGVRPRRVGLGLGWLWAPAVAAASVFVVTYLMNVSRFQNAARMPEVASHTQPSNKALLNPTDLGVFEVQPGEDVENPQEQSESNVAQVRPSTASTPRMPLRREHTGYVASVTVPHYGPDPVYGPAPEASAAIAAETVPTASEVAQPSSTDNGVILIQSDRDMMTGANRATELSSRNVVIGG